MKRIYQVTIASEQCTGTVTYNVVRGSVIDAAVAGRAAYNKDARQGNRLSGNGRVTEVKEIGAVAR